jgi:hypothetical protein
MHCTILFSAHVCANTLDHVEPKVEEPTEQAQVEDLTNIALDQGKPRCIPPIILDFSFNHFLMFYFDWALSYRGCMTPQLHYDQAS